MFLAHGTGAARKAAAYLLGEQDATGKPREGVEVLRGNPDMVAAMADSLDFEHRYTSGVIAWAPDDQPTDEQIEAVLDAFEKTAWAGLEPDRYAWAAVLHRERGGGAHVHVLAARCDLETGRSLNIAPSGWETTFGALQDAFNHEHGWSRPDDPARARVQQPGHRAYVEAAQLRAGLREAGLDVPRQGKNYLTALDPETGKRWRLKGELYAFDFDRERLDRAAANAAGERPQGDRGVDRQRARTARRELAARREECAAYHRTRYGGGGRADARVAPLRPLIVGLGLWLGIFGGSWATMRWLSRTIDARFETLGEVNVRIHRARETMAKMAETTWGVEFQRCPMRNEHERGAGFQREVSMSGGASRSWEHDRDTLHRTDSHPGGSVLISV